MYVVVYTQAYRCTTRVSLTTPTKKPKQMIKISDEVREKPLAAGDLLAAIKSLSAADPEMRVKNPFTSGVAFDEGEEVKFVGFDYSEWTGDGKDGHPNAHGLFPVIVLDSVSTGTRKRLALSSLTKAKGGILVDEAKNPERRKGMWTNDGGLAAVAKGFSELSEDALTAIANFMGNKTHKIRVQWVEVSPTFFTSLVNIL
jgi:hypothetical protein